MTAVEWLVEQFETTINYTIEEYQLKIQQAKRMEKEQIESEREEAYSNGYANGQMDAFTQ